MARPSITCILLLHADFPSPPGAHLLMLEISRCSSCCNSSSPPPMLVLLINLSIHKCNDLGSIKFSLTQTLDSIKSEFTCCSNNFARALVIGPILTSLAFSCTATSSSGKDGKGLGMSSSAKVLLLQPRRQVKLSVLSVVVMGISKLNVPIG